MKRMKGIVIILPRRIGPTSPEVCKEMSLNYELTWFDGLDLLATQNTLLSSPSQLSSLILILFSNTISMLIPSFQPNHYDSSFQQETCRESILLRQWQNWLDHVTNSIFTLGRSRGLIYLELDSYAFPRVTSLFIRWSGWDFNEKKE